MLSTSRRSNTETVGGIQVHRGLIHKTSDGRQNSELDIRIGKAKAVMRQLHRYVVLERVPKISTFKSIYVPILAYGNEGWIVNEKRRSRVQAADM